MSDSPLSEANEYNGTESKDISSPVCDSLVISPEKANELAKELYGRNLRWDSARRGTFMAVRLLTLNDDQSYAVKVSHDGNEGTEHFARVYKDKAEALRNLGITQFAPGELGKCDGPQGEQAFLFQRYVAGKKPNVHESDSIWKRLTEKGVTISQLDDNVVITKDMGWVIIDLPDVHLPNS